jgi:hypothetical protein
MISTNQHKAVQLVMFKLGQQLLNDEHSYPYKQALAKINAQIEDGMGGDEIIQYREAYNIAGTITHLPFGAKENSGLFDTLIEIKPDLVMDVVNDLTINTRELQEELCSFIYMRNSSHLTEHETFDNLVRLEHEDFQDFFRFQSEKNKQNYIRTRGLYRSAAEGMSLFNMYGLRSDLCEAFGTNDFELEAESLSSLGIFCKMMPTF